MPAIKSYHTPIEEVVESRDKSALDMSMLVDDITFDVLKDSPFLVAEADNGHIEQKVLQKAIIQKIDRQRLGVGLDREKLIEAVFAYMFGYGILEAFLADEHISDIDFTRFNDGTIKVNGRKQEIGISFGSEKMFETYCKLIIIRNGGSLNENDTHCRVSDEKRRLRINASIRPRNISGPALSIRKHRQESYTLNDLVGLGMLTEEMADLVYRLAQSDASPVFCGKGGSGKTTMFRSFINNMPKLERVLVTESDSELYPDKPNCIIQKIKKASEGGRPVTLRNLVQDGLTMLLDTYCIGEVVGDECWEAVKAGFTGHRIGATLHTWGVEDVFPRMLTLSMGAGITESERTIKEMMAKSVDIIFHMKGFKVTDIAEVEGYDPVTDTFRYNYLYRFDIDHEDKDGLLTGKFRKYGDLGQKLSEKLRRRGLTV